MLGPGAVSCPGTEAVRGQGGLARQGGAGAWTQGLAETIRRGNTKHQRLFFREVFISFGQAGGEEEGEVP